MNLQHLQELVNRVDEVKIIGRTAELMGVIYHVIGLMRYEQRLQLFALRYDEKYAASVKEAECLNTPYKRPESNREVWSVGPKNRWEDVFHAVRSVTIGDTQWTVKGSSGRRCRLQDWENAVILTEFLRNGWDPAGIGLQDIDSLFLTAIEFVEAYDAIPDFGENPKLLLQSAPTSTAGLVELPVTLTVGGDYPEKLWFKDQTTGETYWAQINSVYLHDIWSEMMKNFDDPLYTERFTAEEIEKAKQDYERHCATVCPRGMCLPAVEYECEEDITLQFYSKAWLEAEPVISNSATGIIMATTDQKLGVSGLKLKIALIQEPVPADTRSIDAELFFFQRPEHRPDVTL